MVVAQITVLFSEEDEATMFSFVTARRRRRGVRSDRTPLALLAERVLRTLDREDLACE